MATLRAVKPEIMQPGKPKFMISGKAGVGKSYFCLDFPSVYYIDTEGGAVREQYRRKLAASGGVYFGKEQGSLDFSTVIEEIKALATTRHDFKTLVIDSFSYLYNTAAAIAEDKVGNDFGRDKKEANRPTRQLIRWLETIDMNVILVCHQRDKWERRRGEVVNVGTTFDGYDKMEFILDLWLEVQKAGNARALIVKKTRIESFPEGLEFPLDYQEFAKLYGKEVIEKPATQLPMATTEQVQKLSRLLEVVKVEPETLAKWKEKANAEDWVDMTEVQIGGCLAFLEKKIAGTNGSEAKQESKKAGNR